MEVQIIRGDDSYFINLKKRRKKDKDDAGATLIQDEEDLFNEKTLLEDDLSLEDNKTNRLIKQDNVISAYVGRIEAQDQDGNSARYNQINAAWAYQLEDNIFVEGSYGQNVIKDFPSTGLDTKLTNLTFKAKYAFQAPFYSFLLPYVGFQVVNADSPGAGVQDSSNPVSEEDLANESARLEDIKKNTVVFGVTLLKRLVPGWFFRADLGSDIIGGGFALEF